LPTSLLRFTASPDWRDSEDCSTFCSGALSPGPGSGAGSRRHHRHLLALFERSLALSLGSDLCLEVQESMTTADLPHLNAALNSTSALLLVTGWLLIRKS
jgi:hypothetical protein